MSDLKPEGALDGRTLKESGIQVTAGPRTPRFNVRGQSTAVSAVLEPLLGVVAPTTPNTVHRGEKGRVDWLGPDEWLVAPAPDSGPSADALHAAAGAQGIALVEVSDGLVTIHLSGPRAPELLRAGMPYDLRALVEGTCAQTRLAQASVIIAREADARWQLLVRRSMADYVWRWLDAALLRLTPNPV
ncbi:MAG: sarcosine oxidase subunit gamma [Pseudomonadota bacterium]